MIDSETTISEHSGHYTLAGWVAIIQAVLVVPQMILAIGVDYLSENYPELKIILVVLQLVGLGGGVYVLYVFKRLLNDRFHFHDVDVFINVFIGINILTFFLGIAGLSDDYSLAVTIIIGIILLIHGILSIAFGIMLMRLKDNLFGLLKPYAYLTISSGILAATVLLAPLGMLLAIVALVVQGMIFLRASEESDYL